MISKVRSVDKGQKKYEIDKRSESKFKSVLIRGGRSERGTGLYLGSTGARSSELVAGAMFTFYLGNGWVSQRECGSYVRWL